MEYIPPHSTNAEEAVLGAMLFDKESIGVAYEILREGKVFYNPSHGKIFDVIVALFNNFKPADITTVADVLEKGGHLTDCGGRVKLVDLMSGVASSANLEHHANIVYDKFQLRETIRVSQNIIHDCFRQEDETPYILNRAEASLYEITNRSVKSEFTLLSDLMPAILMDLEARQKAGGGITGISTGFMDVDKRLAGLHGSELIILAGRPSMGKSALALNIAENVCEITGKAVAFFSLEMSKKSLAERSLFSVARINSHDGRMGLINSEEWDRVSAVQDRIHNRKILIDSTGIITPLQLRSRIRRLIAKQPIALVVVDYIQMMSPDKKTENRTNDMTDISRKLKGIAKEFDLPVIGVSQLSRAVETRGGSKRPQLSDLRESGAIEQDADVVMFVYREEYYLKHLDKDDPKLQPVKGVAEIFIDKHRNGPTGRVELRFNEEYVTFDNLERFRSSGVVK